MTSLYEAIGSDPKASDADVKKAYRRAAKKAHPDAGGDVEEFKAVSYAGMILCNPAKRAHYDRTGEEQQPHNEVERRIASMIGQAFEQDGKDPIRVMCEFIDKQRSAVKSDVAKFKQAEKKLRMKHKKFIETNKATKNTAARDFIVASLEHRIEEQGRMVAAAENELEIASAMLTYLNDLRCPAERSEGVTMRFQLGGSGFASSGWSGGFTSP